jgi:hypothetical protein
MGPEAVGCESGCRQPARRPATVGDSRPHEPPPHFTRLSAEYPQPVGRTAFYILWSWRVSNNCGAHSISAGGKRPFYRRLHVSTDLLTKGGGKDLMNISKKVAEREICKIRQ